MVFKKMCHLTEQPHSQSSLCKVGVYVVCMCMFCVCGGEWGGGDISHLVYKIYIFLTDN